jgi:hypothetical protein
MITERVDFPVAGLDLSEILSENQIGLRTERKKSLKSTGNHLSEGKEAEMGHWLSRVNYYGDVWLEKNDDHAVRKIEPHQLQSRDACLLFYI